jgi:hypothetical protein
VAPFVIPGIGSGRGRREAGSDAGGAAGGASALSAGETIEKNLPGRVCLQKSCDDTWSVRSHKTYISTTTFQPILPCNVTVSNVVVTVVVAVVVVNVVVLCHCRLSLLLLLSLTLCDHS